MNRVITQIKNEIQRATHPVFFASILFASILWFVTKMSNEYNESVKIPVTIEQQNFDVICNIRSSGYRLLLNNIFPQSNRVYLSLDEVGLQRNSETENRISYYQVPSYLLYNAIASHVSNFTVLNVITTIHVKCDD